MNITPFNINLNILLVNTINIIPDNLFEYIDYTHLALLNDINVNQQFSIIIQEDNYIIDNTIQIDTYNYYIPFSHFIDINNQDINTSYIVDYLINKIITTKSVINIQFQRLIYNQFTSFFISQQLNIINHTGNVLNIHHKLYFKYINLENYITSHLMIISVFDIVVIIINLSQFIIEHYSTIFETNIIRNVETSMTSYVDIKVSEHYISVNDTNISPYPIINTVEIMNINQETGTIVYMGNILSLYVIIMNSKIDNIIMKIEEAKKHILVDILNSRN